MIRVLKKEEGVTVSDQLSVTCKSKQSAVFEIEGRKLGIHPIISADNVTTTLAICFPQDDEKVAAFDWENGAHRVTIWDSQTVAFSVKSESGDTRAFFIKAQLMDPAGAPPNRPEK